MIANDVLSMYENIAGLTNQMVVAAQSSDWDGVGKLEAECASVARRAATASALSGAPRQRKIDLLKQIMANDRAMRELTEPWMAQLSNVMQAPRSAL